MITELYPEIKILDYSFIKCKIRENNKSILVATCEEGKDYDYNRRGKSK